MGVQKHTKKALKKQTHRVEKFLQKIRLKVRNRFSRDFFNHVFGRFSVRGVQKHDKKISKK
jgi:hypothetical protein